MTKEKVLSLEKYLELCKSKKTSAIPLKHKGHPESYLRFLDNEIRMVSIKLEAVKLEGTTK